MKTYIHMLKDWRVLKMTPNNLDDFMGYMITNGLVDETFALKPECPSCGEPLEKCDVSKCTNFSRNYQTVSYYAE